MTALLRSLTIRVQRKFARDAAGVAAVEFALILPVALALTALVVYGGQLYRVQRKVSQSAATVANLVARGDSGSTGVISTAELSQILAYPNLILYPNDPGGVRVVVSEIAIAAASQSAATGTVVWSRANANATPRAVNQQLPVDPNVVAAFTGSQSNAAGATVGYAILGEVQYPFQPYDLYGSVGATTLHDSIMMIPRTTAGVTIK